MYTTCISWKSCFRLSESTISEVTAMFENSCVLLIFQHSFFNNKISLLVHFGHFRDPPNPHLTFKNRALTVVKHQFSKNTFFSKKTCHQKNYQKCIKKEVNNHLFGTQKTSTKWSSGRIWSPWATPGTNGTSQVPPRHRFGGKMIPRNTYFQKKNMFYKTNAQNCQLFLSLFSNMFFLRDNNFICFNPPMKR